MKKFVELSTGELVNVDIFDSFFIEQLNDQNFMIYGETDGAKKIYRAFNTLEIAQCALKFIKKELNSHDVKVLDLVFDKF